VLKSRTRQYQRGAAATKSSTLGRVCTYVSQQLSDRMRSHMCDPHLANQKVTLLESIFNDEGEETLTFELTAQMPGTVRSSNLIRRLTPRSLARPPQSPRTLSTKNPGVEGERRVAGMSRRAVFLPARLVEEQHVLMGTRPMRNRVGVRMRRKTSSGLLKSTRRVELLGMGNGTR